MYQKYTFFENCVVIFFLCRNIIKSSGKKSKFVSCNSHYSFKEIKKVLEAFIRSIMLLKFYGQKPLNLHELAHCRILLGSHTNHPAPEERAMHLSIGLWKEGGDWRS